MLTKRQEAAARFKGFVEETLAAAVCVVREPLTAEVFQTPERITVAEALRGSYRPVSVGWRWGPLRSSAWFRVRGRVPQAMAGKRVCLRFSSGTEALLWKEGVPHHGFDVNRDTALLHAEARGGEAVDCLIEAACNHVLGTTQLWWEPPAKLAHWKESEPGKLEACELVTVDQDAWRLMRTFEFARLMVEQMEESPRLHGLVAALERAVEAVKGAAPACEVTEELEAALAGSGAPSATKCFAVGHAHLDTAWLWPIAETKRKALRTFSNALRLMERFPHYKFLCSQPQQYAWVKERAPELFAQIKQRVKEGRWEAMGAMWVEPDGNLPAGESYVRQILHGVRFFREEFGEAAPQRLAYLPDTFGFAASLPQIFRLAGLDTFITNKLWWNETNEFPFVNFRWRGIDGTEIVSHLTPGHEYNATNTPKELLLGQKFAESKDPAGVNVWLQPFGFGDGGGGPTDWNILYAQLASACQGVAETTMSGAAAFCEQLHHRIATCEHAGAKLPVWEGELYLERHRGTFTTQARVKKDNARAEADLRIAEWLTFAGPSDISAEVRTNAVIHLDAAWKLTLLNQFHDILPGSSIGVVYEDSQRDYEQVRRATSRLERQSIERWIASANGSGFTRPVAVFNPSSSDASACVLWKDDSGVVRRLMARDVPALGFRVFEGVDSGSPQVAVNHGVLDNGLLRARIDKRGCIASLAITGGPELAAEPMGRLVLYHDHPPHWDAWDIQDSDLNSRTLVDTPVAISVEDEFGLATIHTSRSLGTSSHLEQTFRLFPGSSVLEVSTRLDWREDHTLLRVEFPTTVRSDSATFEIPFGHIRRSTSRDTAMDKARFEVPAHRWIDLSETGRGVALLNSCKYGHSCLGGTLGLSLVRSPTWPDPTADRGEHGFTYSLMPHGGDWRAAGVDREAELMVRPMWAVPLTPGRVGACGSVWAPFRISGSAAVRVVAIKPAESGEARRLIVRLVENHGRAGACRIEWALPVLSVESVDLLERPLPLAMRHDPELRTTSFEIKPFQIVTLAVTLDY